MSSPTGPGPYDQPPPYNTGNEKGGPPQMQQPGGYPPPQGGYPPQEGYPPQQPGYPPQQGYPSPQGYPPQGPGYPQQGPGQPTVIIQQPVIQAIVQQFREAPVQTVCPKCQASIITATMFETGTLTWLICVGLCVVGCDLGCCLIPFCVDGCKDVVHSCPNCHQVVARYNRL